MRVPSWLTAIGAFGIGFNEILAYYSLFLELLLLKLLISLTFLLCCACWWVDENSPLKVLRSLARTWLMLAVLISICCFLLRGGCAPLWERELADLWDSLDCESRFFTLFASSKDLLSSMLE